MSSGGVYLIRLGDLTDDLPGGRVDGGERFPVDGVVPFIIDEELNKGRIRRVIRVSDVQVWVRRKRPTLGAPRHWGIDPWCPGLGVHFSTWTESFEM